MPPSQVAGWVGAEEVCAKGKSTVKEERSDKEKSTVDTSCMAPKSAQEKAKAISQATLARRKRQRQRKGRAQAEAEAAMDSSSEDLAGKLHRQAIQSGRKAKRLFEVVQSLRSQEEEQREPAQQQASSSSSSARAPGGVVPVVSDAAACAANDRQRERLETLLKSLPQDAAPPAAVIEGCRSAGESSIGSGSKNQRTELRLASSVWSAQEATQQTPQEVIAHWQSLEAEGFSFTTNSRG